MAREGHYVAVYDISSNKERTKVAKILSGFGFRVQQSAFECRLSTGLKRKLLRQLQTEDIKTGSLFLYRLQSGSKREELGEPIDPSPDADFAFVG